MKAVKSLCIIVWALLAAASVIAQNFSIDWYRIAGGGGTSTSGVYTVSGTIGQHDAGGPMTGGPYSLTGGFWSLVAVQTPGAPLLKVSLTATNTVLISWPSPSTGFTLQQNSSVNSAGGWATVNQMPSDNGTTKSVMVNPPAGNVFYRLKE
jgi:hypothetical protein